MNNPHDPLEALKLVDCQIQDALAIKAELLKQAERTHKGLMEINAKIREFGKRRSELATMELNLGL